MKLLRTTVAAAAVGVAVLGLPSAPASAAPHQLNQFCRYTNSQPTLSQAAHSSGTAVRQAQCELNYAYAFGAAHNYGQGTGNGLAVDGSFGSNTDHATRDFQRCVHIRVDGIIGPDTWAALNYWDNQTGFCRP